MTLEQVMDFREILEKSGYELSHRSTDRGYIAVNSNRVERYCGRFGRGFKLILSSACLAKTNRYHLVEYIIEK